MAARVISSTGQPIRLDVFPNLIGALVATALMLRFFDRRPWSAVDLGKTSATPRTFGAGIASGAAAISAVCVALLASGLLRMHPASGDVSWLGAAARVTIVLAPAALSEEVMCRGYLLTVVGDGIGMRGAVLLTSAMFGALHLSNPNATLESVLVVFLAGVFLASVRLRFRSLYAAWMAHLAWNWVMAVVLHAAVSGLRFEAPRYFAESAGPSWLSGGEWGPEGGLIAALGLMAGVAFLYTRRGREES